MRQISIGNITNYSICEILGQGANGIVYLCDFSVRNAKARKVALKMILNYQGLQTNSLATTNQNEYYILYNLPEIHENIIHILGHFLAKPTMEMIENISLQETVRNYLVSRNRRTGEIKPKQTQFFALEYHPNNLTQKLEELGNSVTDGGRALKYCFQCAKGLEYLFQNHVVHRDIKPDNILVSENDDLIFSDFGEAVIVDGDYLVNKTDLRGGNPRFTAPEVHNQLSQNETRIYFGKQYSWELGMLMYEIVFGEPVFDGYPACYGGSEVHVPELEVQSLQDELRPGEVPDGFVSLIVQLLLNSPNDRIDITEALGTLERM